MTVKNLIHEWERSAKKKVAYHEYHIALPIHDAAKICALAEMFPGRTGEQIIADLIGAALVDFEAALPYVRGKRVIAEDELGDPIYEDAGPTPRFHDASQKHLRELESQKK